MSVTVTLAVMNRSNAGPKGLLVMLALAECAGMDLTPLPSRDSIYRYTRMTGEEFAGEVEDLVRIGELEALGDYTHLGVRYPVVFRLTPGGERVEAE